MPFQREYREAEAVAVALAELSLAVGLEKQRQVGEARHGVLPSEGAVEEYMERCAGQPFLAAYHVGNLHQMVVHDVGKVIGWQLVGTLVEHLVVEDVALYHHVAAYHVVHVDFLSRPDEEAHHVLLALGNHLLHFLFWQCQRVAHLHARVGVILEILYLLSLGLEFFGRVEGDVCLALVEQLLHVFLVYVAPLALAVRAVAAAEAHALVELDAEPLE